MNAPDLRNPAPVPSADLDPSLSPYPLSPTPLDVLPLLSLSLSLSLSIREPVEKYLAMKRKSPPVAAFSIDRHCRCGRVALVYSKREVGSKEAPEVWFQDLSGRWNFLSKTFIVYFRMMVAHLGLPNWQYRFTEYGMDPISTQWFHLIAPGDFTLDLNVPKTRAQAKEKGRPTSSKAAGSSSASQGGPKAKSSGSRGDGLKVGRLGRTSSVARDRIPSAGRRKKQTDSTLVRSSYRVRPSTR